VDPRVEFWDVLIEMGKRVEEVRELVQENGLKYWTERWIKATTTLKQLAQKELDQQPFSQNESNWIKNTVHKYYRHGSGEGWNWDGWYCSLFLDSEQSEKFDPTVADVHTAPPSPDFGFEGTVLSEGVGPVNMMIAAVDNGDNLMMYSGPVFSHFEIIPNGMKRFTDAEWKGVVKKGRKNLVENELTYPEWAKGYVVVSQPVVYDGRVSEKLLLQRQNEMKKNQINHDLVKFSFLDHHVDVIIFHNISLCPLSNFRFLYHHNISLCPLRICQQHIIFN